MGRIALALVINPPVLTALTKLLLSSVPSNSHFLRTFRLALVNILARVSSNMAERTTQVGFLENFCFPSFQDALLDSSVNGALCAVLAGDTHMLARLIRRKADVNYRVWAAVWECP